MIAVFSSFKVSKNSFNTSEHVENSVVAIAPPPEFRRGYGENAVLAGDEATIKSELSTQQILEVAFSVQEQKKRLNRKEFGSFVQNILKWTQNTTRKYLDIAKTYVSFPDLSVLSGIEPFMLLRLCNKKYSKVVERLKEEIEITTLRVAELIKELVTLVPKKKNVSKEYGDAVLQRHPNVEDGTFYYTLKEVNLTDQSGLWLEEKLAKKQTIGQILQQAREQELATTVPQPTDYRLAQLEELDRVIADAREQRAAVAKAMLELRNEQEKTRALEQRVAELESMVVGQDKTTMPEPEQDAPIDLELGLEPEPELGVPEGFQLTQESSVPPPDVLATQLLKCQSWAEVTQAIDRVAEATGSERATVFVSAAKCINSERRIHLVELLAAHIREFPRDRWAYSWLPESGQKLRDKAMALSQTA